MRTNTFSLPWWTFLLINQARLTCSDRWLALPPRRMFCFPLCLCRLLQSRGSSSREAAVAANIPSIATPTGRGRGGGGTSVDDSIPPPGLPQLESTRLDESIYPMFSFAGASPFQEGGASAGDDRFGIAEPTSRGGCGSPVSDPGSPQESVSPTRGKGGRSSVVFSGGGGGGGGAAAPPKVCLVLWVVHIPIKSFVCKKVNGKISTRFVVGWF